MKFNLISNSILTQTIANTYQINRLYTYYDASFRLYNLKSSLKSKAPIALWPLDPARYAHVTHTRPQHPSSKGPSRSDHLPKPNSIAISNRPSQSAITLGAANSFVSPYHDPTTCPNKLYTLPVIFTPF